MSRVSLLVGLAAVLAACAAPSSMTIGTPTPPQETPISAGPTPLLPVAPPSPLFSRVAILSSSLSIVVEDPISALAEFEPMVEEAGGFIASASSWPGSEGSGYANLSARVPPEALGSLRRAALQLGGQVQSESTYTQDVTMEYRSLLERLNDVVEAEGRLQSVLPDAEGPAFARSFILLSELLRQERRNLESQIASYDDRAALASLDVTFTQSSPYFFPIEEGTPTPFRDG